MSFEPRATAPRAPARRWRACLGLAAAVALLAACGGGSGPADEPSSFEGSDGQAREVDGALLERRFVLWTTETEAALREEQRALDPAEAGTAVRLIVRLNPAAVPPASRATIAAIGAPGSAPGTGESGNAVAQRERQLAAQAAAVASAAEAVFTRSVALAAPQARILDHYAHAIEGFVASVPWEQAPQVAAELARDPAVDSVEPDRRVSVAQTLVARTLDAGAWGVDRIDQRARSFDRRFVQTLTGRGVNVFVVDTGVAPHREFGDRLLAGFSAVADGWGTRDCQGHGTHVAGTAAGATVGVAPGAAVVPVRVLGCNGSGATSGVIAGLDWIVARGARPGVVNISLGGPASAAVDAAVERLTAAGFAVVAAAGNDNADACAVSPARAPTALAVGASDAGDAKAAFSNWGSCVALWAPGTQIGSAGIASTTALVAMSGTSMASPHVAGAAALRLQDRPTLAPAQVRAELVAQATAGIVAGAPAATTRHLLYAGPSAPPAVAPAPRMTVAALALAAQVPTPGQWAAVATVRVVDERGQPLAGASVAGRFSTMASGVSCTTASDGSCRLTSLAASWTGVPAIGFAVTGLRAPTHVDAGSGTRAAQLARPPAPMASVAALTGSMAPTAPGATTWRPAFTVRLVDGQGAPVAGATVSAVLVAHARAQAVARINVGCTTAADGRCTLTWTGPPLGSSLTGATVQITGVARSFLGYQPGPNALARASVGVTQ